MPRGTVIVSLVAPATPALELEEREHGDDDYNPISTGVPGVELVEEEAFALALKASMDSTLEERAAQIASLLFDDFPSIHCFSNIFIIMLGLL